MIHPRTVPYAPLARKLVLMLGIALLGALPLPAQQGSSEAEAAQALQDYRTFASNGNPHVRRAAVDDLGTRDHEDVALELLKALADRDESVREAAVAGLGKQRSAGALKALTKEFDRARKPFLQVALLRAFRESRPPAAFATIEELATARSFDVRRAAVEALGAYGAGPSRERAAGALVQALEDREALVRLAAIDALREIKHPATARPLLEALKDRDWRVQAAAIEAQLALREGISVPALAEMMEREKGRLQDDAYEALKKLTGQDMGRDPERWTQWWERTGSRRPLPTEEEIREKKRKIEAAGSAYARPDRKYPPYHGIRTRSRRMIFAIDVSSSMAEKITLNDGDPRRLKEHRERYGDEMVKIAIARKELIDVIARLQPHVAFDIVVFDSTARRWKGRLTRATGGTKNAAIKFLARLQPTGLGGGGSMKRGGGDVSAGRTNTFEAINAAFGLMRKGAHRDSKKFIVEADTLFLLSDGMPSCGRIVEPQALGEYVETINQRARLVIHTISFGNANEAFMRGLAEMSGGRYVQIGN